MESAKPSVIILDLDGTVIGDITPQLMSFEIARDLRKYNRKVNFDGKELQFKLKNYIVRPHFKNFVKNIKSEIPHVEFFIYTASEKKWAHTIIKFVEISLQIKFNRPIFTRDDCNHDLKKCLNAVAPKIVASLKKKYAGLHREHLNNRMLIVDNNAVYKSADSGSLLLCPTYDYKYPENVMTIVKHEDFGLYHRLICHLINKYIDIPSTDDYFAFQQSFYSYYMSLLAATKKSNDAFLRDKFWLYLKTVLVKKKFKKFTPNVVSYIQHKINKKMSR